MIASAGSFVTGAIGVAHATVHVLAP
jgi:hypothetical protein